MVSNAQSQATGKYSIADSLGWPHDKTRVKSKSKMFTLPRRCVAIVVGYVHGISRQPQGCGPLFNPRDFIGVLYFNSFHNEDKLEYRAWCLHIFYAFHVCILSLGDTYEESLDRC